MTGNKEAVSVLRPLLRATEEPCPLILLGAGASFRSGVPTAAEAVKQIERRVYSEVELKNARPPERVKPSEWESWLQGFDWFVPGNDRLAENFPLVVEHLLVPAEFRKRMILDLMRPVNGISAGYNILADFVMRGLIRTMLTTNFDTCLPDALKERQPHIRHIHEVNRGRGDYDQFSVYSKCQIIWLHGRAEQYSDKNAAGETGALDSNLLSLVRPMLDASPIIIIGYRGSEPSIMEGLFGQNKEGRLDFSNGVYWKSSVAVQRKEIEALPDSKRVLSWLLRKHLEYHLLSFEEEGLLLEYGRKYRAYFTGNNRGERTITWNSAQRRGNKRDVVKKRAEGPRPWFENEGFGYEIVDVGGLWCVRIKPFYMFTGFDAVRPLPSFTRSAKATRRIKFDRNKNVEADLAFWASFLGRGAETMNVGGLHVDDLLIDMTFLTVEVPEVGLSNSEPEHKNRMST